MNMQEIRDKLQRDLDSCDSQLLYELKAKTKEDHYSVVIDYENIMQICELKEMIRACDKLLNKDAPTLPQPINNQPLITLY